MTAAHAIPEESAPEVAGAENANEGSNNPDAAGGVEARPPPPLDNADAAGGAGGAQLPDDDAPPPPDAAAPGGQEMAAAADDADADAGAAMPQQMQALATDLSSYFATLQGALSQQRSANGNSATGIGSTVVSLLLDGTSLVVAAGNAAGVDIWGFMSAAAGTHNSPPGALLTPRQAALYLYAVGQNVVALEAAVLGSRPPPAMFAAAGGGGFDMDEANAGGGGGGITAKQVAEIVSAVGIAATFCNSRSIINQSGILPALAHLIESTGTLTAPPSSYRKTKNGNKGDSNGIASGGVLRALTPFHADFLQVSLLAGQYRYASSFLAVNPTSHTSLDFPYLRLDPTTYLRTHYYAGLVHVGCNDWNSALDSLHLCLTMPCGSNVSAIAVAARKKSLLVQCLLLESEELDDNNAGSAKSGYDAQARGGGIGSGKSAKSALETKVLELPGAASAAVSKYMAASSNRVDRGSSAPEKTNAGTETSEQPSGRERSTSGRRRMRSANSNASSDAAAGGDPTAEQERSNGRPSPKTYSHLGSYHDLISTYISGNASHYAKLLSEMNELLHVDGNWGLAHQLMGRLAYRAVREVASVYSVAGLEMVEGKMAEVCSELASSSGGGGEVGKRGVEDVLMGMMSSDAKDALLVDPFVAKIDHSTGMVSFLDHEDDDESSDEEWMEADLSNRLQSCIALAERVRDLDIGLTTSPKYQQYALKQMMMKGDSNRASAAMKGTSVADIGHGSGPMDVGVDW